MIRRSMDAAHLNRLANDPSVRPQMGGEGDLDLSPVINDPVNFALVVEHGAFVFGKQQPGRYELHTMLLPEGRGAGVLPTLTSAFRWMFVNTDCDEIVTLTPGSNPAAALMARRAGFDPMFERKAAWSDGSDLTFFTLTLDRWLGRDATLEVEGHEFHVRLEAAKVAAGSDLPTHPDDAAHDRAVGAACLMAKAGNAAKAVWTYNRWASLARYQMIDLVSTTPPVIDVRDALVTFAGGETEVLQCRQAR